MESVTYRDGEFCDGTCGAKKYVLHVETGHEEFYVCTNSCIYPLQPHRGKACKCKTDQDPIQGGLPNMGDQGHKFRRTKRP